uniref:U2A'/phosphoprotein 32 family A C-terminal domain-containing protein n=1 Tax=Ciona savignyi TaxID=51511 RepID=H2ZQ33_CIOSA
MLKRIQLESRGMQPDQIVDLNLDNCRSAGEPEGLTDDFTSLKKLSMINAGITSLKGFPALSSLLKLELSDNRISGSLASLKGCTALTHLNLSGNKIKTIDALQPLADLPQLTSLDLFNCEVTKVNHYRENAFALLPNLKYLDGFDANDTEAVDSDDEEGSGDEEENGLDANHVGNGDDEDDDDDDDEDDAEDGEEEDDEDVPPNEDSRNSVEDDSDAGSEEEEEVGLAYLDGEIEDEEDDGDYEGEDDEEEDDEIDEEDEQGAGESSRGVKRKHEDEEEKAENQ